MSVYGINSTQAAILPQDLTSNGTAYIADTFQNALQSKMLALQTNENDSQDYNLISGLQSGSSDVTALLMAVLLQQGISSPAMMSMRAALSRMSASRMQNSQTASAYSTSGTIPSQPSKPVYPGITSNANNRSAQLYRRVINQFSVETNPRYEVNQKGHNDTYCNIFVWDVTRAMGAEIPHYYNAETGEPMEYGDKGANEMTANRMYDWLHQHGGEYGWFKVTPEQAQHLANQGRPVVTALRNNSGHGHVQVVCPSNDGQYDEARGVTIAQAGRRLTSYRPITEIYNASLPKVVYFAHL